VLLVDGQHMHGLLKAPTVVKNVSGGEYVTADVGFHLMYYFEKSPNYILFRIFAYIFFAISSNIGSLTTKHLF
jgi:hypothetical protein